MDRISITEFIEEFTLALMLVKKKNCYMDSLILTKCYIIEEVKV